MPLAFPASIHLKADSKLHKAEMFDFTFVLNNGTTKLVEHYRALIFKVININQIIPARRLQQFSLQMSFGRCWIIDHTVGCRMPLFWTIVWISNQLEFPAANFKKSLNFYFAKKQIDQFPQLCLGLFTNCETFKDIKMPVSARVPIQIVCKMACMHTKSLKHNSIKRAHKLISFLCLFALRFGW